MKVASSATLKVTV